VAREWDCHFSAETSPAFRITTWQAPTLDCQNLHIKSEQMTQDGSFRISAETKVTLLVIGDPDPHLFEIGQDLVEMKPSEAGRRYWDSLKPDLDALGLSVQENAVLLRDMQQEWAEEDKRYQSKE
jgi:hypothetical protein